MSQKSGEQVVREGFAEAFHLAAEDCERPITPIEKSIITCCVFLSFAQMLEDRQYQYPNKIGRATAVLAFGILGNDEAFNLPAMRRALGLSNSAMQQQFTMAANKEVNDVWVKCTARALIVGTRRALYAIGGMDPHDLNGEAIVAAAKWLHQHYAQMSSDRSIGQEMTTLLNYMGELTSTELFQNIFDAS